MICCFTRHILSRTCFSAFCSTEKALLRSPAASHHEIHDISFERLATSVTPAHAQALFDRGFVVIDDALEDHACDAFKQEIATLQKAAQLHLNSTHLVRRGQRDLLQKHAIYEAEMADKGMQAAAPVCASFQQDRTLLTMLSIFLPRLRLHSQLIKLQYNAGDGGCFPLHYDSDETVDARRITAIMYLNPDWCLEHGGELQLFPWPHPPVTVAPLHNRLVLFSSCRMLHRVLPAQVERFCFTTWMSVMNPGPPPLSLQALHERGLLAGESAWDLCSEPEFKKAAAKVYYKDIWARSLVESHRDSAAREQMLEDFWKEIDLLQKVMTDIAVNLGDIERLMMSMAEDSQRAGISWF